MTVEATRRALVGAMLVAAAVATTAAATGTQVRATYGAQTSADEPHYLLTAMSLATDHDLDIADEHAAGAWRSFHEVGLPPQARERGDGSMIAPHDPLLAVLLAVPVTVGGWVGAKLALAGLGGALAAATVWLTVRRLHVRPATAAVVAGLFGASAPLAVYGTQVYPEVPAALALVIAVGAATARPRARAVATLVGAVVALPWLAVKTVPVAAAVTGVAVWRWWRSGARRHVVVLVVTLAAAGAAYVAAHLAWYGGVTVYASGAFFAEHGGQLSVLGTRPDVLGRTRRLLGLLVDDQFGLVPWQPAYLLAVPAVAAALRRRPTGWAALLVPLGVGWLVATFVAVTMQGWWFPGRHVVVVLPLALAAVAAWADRSPRRLAVSVLAAATGVVTYAWLVVDGLAGRLTWIVDFASTAAPPYRLLAPVFPHYLDVTPRTWVLHGAWLVLVALLAVAGWRGAGQPPTATSVAMPSAKWASTAPSAVSTRLQRKT